MAAALLATLLGVEWVAPGAAAFPATTPILLAAVFFGLYTAHLMDTYVDVVKRSDRTPTDYPLLFRDSTGLLPDRAYPPLVAASALLCAGASVPAVAAGGVLVALSLAVGLAIAMAYAPLLDRHTLGVSFAYPTGVVAASAAGFALASGTLDGRWALIAASLFLALTGTKIRSDIIDYDEDVRIGKRTVPVVIGKRGAIFAGYGLALAGLGLAAALPAFMPVSPWVAVPAVGAACALLISVRSEPFRGSMMMAASLFVLLFCEVALLAVA